MSAEGARGKLPPTSRFSRFPLRGGFGKIGACEGTQAVLAVTSKRKFLVLAACKKKRKFFEERTHIRELPLSTINITNSGERGGEKMLDHAFQRLT